MRLDRKSIVKNLLNGMYLMKRKNHDDVAGYKIYSGNMVPESFITEKQVMAMERTSPYSLFKKDSKEKLTLNLSNIRRLHGNHWIKKIYKSHLLTKAKK